MCEVLEGMDMMRFFPVALALAALPVMQVQAQNRQEQPKNARHGFWFSGGLGWGSVGAECVGCRGDRSGGLSGAVRMGGTLGGGRFLLGGETNAWLHSQYGINQNIGFVSFVFVWYPSLSGAFFLKVGVGGMYSRPAGGFTDVTATAPAGSVGLGYDIRVAPNLSVTPYLNVLATSSVEVKLSGVTVPSIDITTNLVQIGVALTVH
jgi:hypothetical protein